MTIALVWEPIGEKHEQLARTRTPTGWLVCKMDDVYRDDPNRGGMQSGWEWRTAIAFVPDPDGVWLA